MSKRRTRNEANRRSLFADFNCYDGSPILTAKHSRLQGGLPLRVVNAFVDFLKRSKRTSNQKTEKPKRKKQRKQRKHDHSVFRGFVAYDNSPIYTSMRQIKAHGAYIGSSGSNKSAYLQMLIEQLLRRGDCSLVVIDPKSFSREIFATVMDHQDRLSKVWWLTDQLGHSSHLCSVMHQNYWAAMSTVARGDTLLASTAISLVRQYGPMFFADLAAAGFFVTLSKHPHVNSFRELARRLNEQLEDPRDLPIAVKHHGLHNAIILDRLSVLDAFNYEAHYPQAVLDGQVDFSRLYKEPCALYCGINVTLSALAGPELLRIILASTLFAGAAMEASARKMNVFVIADEFASFLSPDLTARSLAIARGADCSIQIATQSISDLNLGHGANDLTSTVLNNTAIQQFHSVRDDKGTQLLQALSGNTLSTLNSETTATGPNGATSSKTVSETVIPRYSVNQINEISAAEDQFLMRIRTNDVTAYDGHLFAARCPYHVDLETYERRLHFQWPEPQTDTLVVGDMDPPTDPTQDASTPTPPKPPADGPIVTKGRFGVTRGQKGQSHES